MTPPATPDRSTVSGRRAWMIAAFIIMTTVAHVAVGSAHAGAAVRTSSGASASTWFSCNPQLHAIRYEVSMRPATTFASQYTAYRVWVHSYTTGAGTWTDWRYMNAPETHANFVPLPRSSGTNNYAMYMEYSWWNGRTWSGTGEWITTYTQQTLYGGYFYQNYCTA